MAHHSAWPAFHEGLIVGCGCTPNLYKPVLPPNLPASVSGSHYPGPPFTSEDRQTGPHGGISGRVTGSPSAFVHFGGLGDARP